MIPIAKLNKGESITISSNVVVIVYPVWFHSVPPIVEEFVKNLILKDCYTVAICTYFVKPYNSLFKLDSVLKQNDTGLNVGFSIQMPGKYVLLKDLTASDEEQGKIYLYQKKRIKEIAEVLKERKDVGLEGCFDENEKGEIENYHKNIYKTSENFWTTDKCNLCGLCTKICPRNNILIENNKVLWKSNCDICLACLHWCPEAAIQNGKLSPNYRRYHHPDISMVDIIDQK